MSENGPAGLAAYREHSCCWLHLGSGTAIPLQTYVPDPESDHFSRGVYGQRGTEGGPGTRRLQVRGSSGTELGKLGADKPCCFSLALVSGGAYTQMSAGTYTQMKRHG